MSWLVVIRHLGYKHDDEDDSGRGDDAKAEAGRLEAGRDNEASECPGQPQRQHQTQSSTDVSRLTVVLTDPTTLSTQIYTIMSIKITLI